jgi:hypothetical protein
MTEVTLTPNEQTFIKALTKKRLQHNEKTGACNTPYGDSTLEEVLLRGFSGELAFCRIFNIFPSFEYDNYRNNTFDCHINGLEIEVKTTNRQDGWLGVKDCPKIDNDLPDYFALMYECQPATYRFMGFCSASSIINPAHYTTNLGYYQLPHPLYTAYQQELVPEIRGWKCEQHEKQLS